MVLIFVFWNISSKVCNNACILSVSRKIILVNFYSVFLKYNTHYTHKVNRQSHLDRIVSTFSLHWVSGKYPCHFLDTPRSLCQVSTDNKVRTKPDGIVEIQLRAHQNCHKISLPPSESVWCSADSVLPNRPINCT